MTDNKTNELVNDVVEETAETADQTLDAVENSCAQGECAPNQGEFVPEQNVAPENQGQYGAYAEVPAEQQPAQFAEQEDTQSFADKIDLDEKVAATKNFFGDFWNFIKVCFTQSFPHGVKKAATEKTPYWLVIMAANAIFMGLSILIMVNKIFSPINAIMRTYGTSDSLIPGGYSFLIGFLASLLFFWIVVGGTIGLLAICKKTFNFQSVCNVIAVAWLPLTLICIVNMLIGFIYAPLAVLLASVAQIMFYILLYMGIQSLAKFQKSPFLWFSIMMLAVLIVYTLILGIILNSMTSSLMESAAGGLGNMFFR